MAGSFRHLIDADSGTYLGTELLDHMGDASEALEECFEAIAFVLSELRAAQEDDERAYVLRQTLRARLRLQDGENDPAYPIIHDH